MARGICNNNAKKKGATQVFEATLRGAADKLRKNMDVVEYNHIVLGHRVIQ